MFCLEPPLYTLKTIFIIKKRSHWRIDTKVLQYNRGICSYKKSADLKFKIRESQIEPNDFINIEGNHRYDNSSWLPNRPFYEDVNNPPFPSDSSVLFLWSA